MEVTVALVADDLTGALDAAAPFAGRGLRVTVFRGPGTLPAPPGRALSDSAAGTARTGPAPGGMHPGSVLAVSTSSRHLDPAAARAAVESAGRRLAAWSPRLVFKKVDSTLRGPLADEVAAAMETFERRTALVCPAFPAAGRIVRGGAVFVRGEPLAETEYALDLRTRAPTGNLAEVFEGSGAVRRVATGSDDWTRPAAGIAIADAETDADLAELAARIMASATTVLAVGSDGLATGLAGLLGRPQPGVGLDGRSGGVLLFALGSRSATAQGQLDRLLRARPDTPVLDAPGGAVDAERVARAAASARVVVVRVPAVPRGEPDAVVRTFAGGVRTAIDGLGGPPGLAALVATGGDTVEAILDAFGIAELDVQGEFRSGIPVSVGRVGDGAELVLVSKAGGFGELDLFAEIAAEAAAG